MCCVRAGVRCSSLLCAVCCVLCAVCATAGVGCSYREDSLELTAHRLSGSSLMLPQSSTLNCTKTLRVQFQLPKSNGNRRNYTHSMELSAAIVHPTSMQVGIKHCDIFFHKRDGRMSSASVFQNWRFKPDVFEAWSSQTNGLNHYICRYLAWHLALLE